MNLRFKTVLMAGALVATFVVGKHAVLAQVKDQAVQLPISTRSAPILSQDGLRFRDLDKDGRLTPFEDWRLSPEARASDLVARMTLAEKAGAVMHGNLPGIGPNGNASSQGYDLAQANALILNEHITSFITRLAVTPLTMAEQNNAIQATAEKGRLGIPVTVSTDPRHHFIYLLGQSAGGTGYSLWPETPGFGALHDANLVRRFADIARREYRATGIHQALSPQADLYTDPRWARGYGSFGADPMLVRSMVEAYVEGFQGGRDGIGGRSVLATAKHWVAYGATVNGFDGHNYYGRNSRVDAKTLALHIQPFEGAFQAGVGAIMPTYNIIEGAVVDGAPVEPVAAGFNRQLLQDLLRGTYGFRGLIVSDWAITKTCTPACLAPTAQAPQTRADFGMPWGVESLTPLQRFAKAMNAGIDQFGGVDDAQPIIDAVDQGLVSQARLDASVARVMLVKFQLGLFDDPFVDTAAVSGLVNTPEVARMASRAQAEAQVLLKDPRHLLPLKPGTRVFVGGIDPAVVRDAGLVPVDEAAQADVALVRVAAPFEKLHPYHFIGSHQHEGRLDFQPGNLGLEAVRTLSTTTPVIAAVFLDRPAVLGEMNDLASVVLANFGISDAALLSAVTGQTPPRGRLPFELPSSMATVETQNPALPDDSLQPLYRAGFGIVPKP